ncbi:MAG: glycosyltransferase family 2 protein [Prevotellaceae bacterium]|nr:glycosyltransferase family 2 protein [Prevotellaceae bacterium]
MIYIVVPCYNEEEVLRDSCRQLLGITETLEEEARLLFVDDGSRDRTWELIRSLSEANDTVLGLRLSHNVGHQRALWAGMEAAAEHADAVISIDADLQDDIEVIPRMVRDFREGADIVYGVRKGRQTDSWLKRQTAQGFYRMMEAMGCQTVYNHADFRLLGKLALKALLSFPERNLYLRGLVPTLGFAERTEYYDRKPRRAGETKYPLTKMLSLALDGVTSFSVRPLRLISALGLLFVLVALGVCLWALVTYIESRSVPGWTSLLISIWFVGGVLLCAIGITGEYISKIYTEVKRRPHYFLRERAGDWTHNTI